MAAALRVGGARVARVAVRPASARPAPRAAPLAPRAGRRINGYAPPAAAKTVAVEDEEEVSLYVDDEEEFEDEDDGSGLTTAQVQQLLSVMCDETDVAELEVRLGSFELRVVRSTDGLPDAPDSVRAAAGGLQTAPGAPTIPAPAPGTAFASTASMDGAAPLPTASLDATASLDDESEDDVATTLLVGSPKVGILRRGKYVKGKRVGKGNVVEEGAEIKKGQVLAFVEQLGTFMPVEAPQAGELLEFLVEDGDPVEFRQPVVEFAPFFGGHIIGDSKHA